MLSSFGNGVSLHGSSNRSPLAISGRLAIGTTGEMFLVESFVRIHGDLKAAATLSFSVGSSRNCDKEGVKVVQDAVAFKGGMACYWFQNRCGVD